MIAEADLLAKVRAGLAAVGAISEIKMFGGIAFMLSGNMVAAVSSRGLLLRVGKDRAAEALARPGARPMEMRGRRMQGYVRVDPQALTDGALAAWLAEASAFVRNLPPKATAGKRNARGDRR
jgi:TfoX/Sxy family transcriptional regulator of competence genes